MKKIPVTTLLIAYASFISLGLFDGLIGIAWPSMRGDFDQSLGALGLVAVSLTTGHIIASVLNGRMVARRGIAFLLPLSSGIMLLGNVMQAGAQFWWMIVAGTIVIGRAWGCWTRE